MKTKALAPWFGSNRMLAEKVGASVSDCDWVGLPFMGGGSELLHIHAKTVIANDLHGQIINLANVVKDSKLGAKLIRELRRAPFHVETLREAQKFCREGAGDAYQQAYAYFICCWMGRASAAGTSDEFWTTLSVRWEPSGGDSTTRYHSAIRSLREWQRIFRRVYFTNLDCFEFLGKCKDLPGHGIYCDPPFPDAGASYKFNFTVEQHRRLATVLARYKRARVVCRFYQHPLIEELYPRSTWRWSELVGRKQSNGDAPELLITNREYSLFD